MSLASEYAAACAEIERLKKELKESPRFNGPGIRCDVFRDGCLVISAEGAPIPVNDVLRLRDWITATFEDARLVSPTDTVICPPPPYRSIR
jgi:hypothetical protein